MCGRAFIIIATPSRNRVSETHILGKSALSFASVLSVFYNERVLL